MARATYIYKVRDNWNQESVDGQIVPVERCFTVKWEAWEYIRDNKGNDDPQKRFYVTRFRDGQHVEPIRMVV